MNTADHIQALQQAFEQISASRDALDREYVQFRVGIAPPFPELQQKLEAIDFEQIQRLLKEAAHIAQCEDPMLVKQWRFNCIKRMRAEARQMEVLNALNALMVIEGRYRQMRAEEREELLRYPRIHKYLVDQTSG